MADAPDLGSGAERRAGSSPVSGKIAVSRSGRERFIRRFHRFTQIKFWLVPLIFVPKNLRNLWIKFLCEICGQTDSGTICCPRETLLAVRRNRSRRNALLRDAAAIRR